MTRDPFVELRSVESELLPTLNISTASAVVALRGVVDGFGVAVESFVAPTERVREGLLRTSVRIRTDSEAFGQSFPDLMSGVPPVGFSDWWLLQGCLAVAAVDPSQERVAVLDEALQRVESLLDLPEHSVSKTESVVPHPVLGISRRRRNDRELLPSGDSIATDRALTRVGRILDNTPPGSELASRRAHDLAQDGYSNGHGSGRARGLVSRQRPAGRRVAGCPCLALASGKVGFSGGRPLSPKAHPRASRARSRALSASGRPRSAD